MAESNVTDTMSPVAHAAWICFWALVAVALFGVATLGMVGLTRAANRLGTRHGWRRPGVVIFTIAGGVAAFLGGWVIYVCWWPLVRLFRPWPRLRLVGPIGVITLLLGGGVTFVSIGEPCAFDPPPGDVSSLSVINDTATAVVVGECYDDSCRSQDQSLQIAAGARGSLQIEACSGGELIVSRTGQISHYGCVREPTEDDNSELTPIRLSAAQPCAR